MMVATRIGPANIANIVSIWSSPSAVARERAQRGFVPKPKFKTRPLGVKTAQYAAAR